KRVENSTQRMGAAIQKTGQVRGGLQQLSFQVNDVASQMAMGTKASVIFAQQSGQVIQALQIMGGGGNAFLRFLAGPWGLALTTAGVILSAFAGKLFESKDAVGDLVEKMRDQAKQAALAEQANRAWLKTYD